jgi:hypothetical protein
MVPLARSALWAVLWQNIQRCHGLLYQSPIQNTINELPDWQSGNSFMVFLFF